MWRGAMVPRRADAERQAVDELGRDLRLYTERAALARASIERTMRRIETEAQAAIDRARGELGRAVERLQSCRRHEGASCSSEAAEVERARQHLQNMYTVAAEIRQLDIDHSNAALRYRSALESLEQAAQQQLQRAGSALDTYLAQNATRASDAERTSLGGQGATDGRSQSPDALHQPPGFPSDIFMVPLSLIDDDDSQVRGPADFGKGYTPADLEWAHEAFVRIIMPGVVSGQTYDDFQARDAREGRIGTRSYADTYSGFFDESEAIRLSAAGQRFSVDNGYHRIWVARQMGIDMIPAKVWGHGLA